MSETIPCSEAPDDPLRTAVLSKRSDAEKAQRRADAEARRAARNVELLAMRAELATLWRVLREFIAARPDLQDHAYASLASERMKPREDAARRNAKSDMHLAAERAAGEAGPLISPGHEEDGVWR